PAVVGLDRQAGYTNYLLGNDPSQWHPYVPRFDRVEYQQVYAGVDLVYYGNDQSQLEYDFVVAPGADTSAIALRFDGAQGMAVDGQGDLVLPLAGGDVVQHSPVVYQDVGGVQTPVAAAYQLNADGTVGVRLAAHDTSRGVVIDPVLTYSSFLGGSG